MTSASIKPIPLEQQPQAWKKELAGAYLSVSELLRDLELEHLAGRVVQAPDFCLRAPRAYVAKMRKGDANDPLLKQVLPSIAEQQDSGILDPVGDLDALTVPGLLHKYHGRALIITTGACAINCRYCFRRHYPYADAALNTNNLQRIVDYLASHTEITEIILSGGDPLVLDDSKLARLCNSLEAIPHLKYLRLHTRLPVVLASRVNEPLLDWLGQTRFKVTMVIHANHANELGEQEFFALQKLKQAGITLLNQSVLLRGINDEVTTLVRLSQRLFECGVMPYYLHLLDPVRGAMHFEVGQARGCDIMDGMRRQLPGYLLPRLVREEKGAAAKTAIFSI